MHAPVAVLLAAAALLGAARFAPLRPAADEPAHGCRPGACTLAPPSPEEADAIADEARRLLDRHVGDSTPLGRQCAALGARMRDRAGDVRMLAYMWRAADPDGHLAPVTGDAHRTEPAPGAGTVHIARGFDALNPDRGLAAIVQTARHEFAHLSGLEGALPGTAGFDAADQLATACGVTAAPR